MADTNTPSLCNSSSQKATYLQNIFTSTLAITLNSMRHWVIWAKIPVKRRFKSHEQLATLSDLDNIDRMVWLNVFGVSFNRWWLAPTLIHFSISLCIVKCDTFVFHLPHRFGLKTLADTSYRGVWFWLRLLARRRQQSVSQPFCSWYSVRVNKKLSPFEPPFKLL